MAAAVRAVNTVALSSTSNTSFTKPTGTTSGDIILIIISAGNNPAVTVTAPSGFSSVTGFPVAYSGSGIGDSWTVRFYAFYKVAGGSEGASYATSHSTASTEGIIYAISGANTTTPINPSPTSASHNGGGSGHATLTAPGITPAVDGSLVIWYGGTWDAVGLISTQPTGTTPTFTERLNTSGGVVYISDGVMTPAGATGDKSVVTTQGGDRPHAQGMIVVEAGVGGGGPVEEQPTSKRWGGVPHMGGRFKTFGGGFW
jgi:hypothetical protein